MNKKILLIGAGGHCKSVIDTLVSLNIFDEIAVIDKKEKVGEKILGYPIIGTDDDLHILKEKGYTNAFVTVGSVGNPNIRLKIFKKILELGYEIPNIIDKTAVVSSFSMLGIGIFIGKSAIVNANATIKKGAIINSGAIVEHDCFVGEFAHISTGATLCGNVNIGDRSHIGAKAVVKQQIRIGSDVIIGAGSVVVKDTKDKVVAYGCPSKEVNVEGIYNS